MGWLENQDARNQRRVEEQNRRLGGDDWVERLDDDMSDLDRAMWGIRGIVGAAFAIAIFVAVVVVLIRWIATGG